MKLKFTTLTFALLCGLWIGDAVATPVLSGAGQVNPAVYPVPTSFTTTFGFANPGSLLMEVRVGRDDTSPYCSITASNPGGWGAPFVTPASPVQTVTYRPLWDTALMPGITGPSSADFTAQWTAVHAVADSVFRARTTMNGAPGGGFGAAYYMFFVLDPSAGTSAGFNEFYKFEISY